MANDVDFNDRRQPYVVTNPAGQDEFVITFPVVVTEGAAGIDVYANDVLLAPEDYTVDLDAMKIITDSLQPQGTEIVLQGRTAAIRELAYPLRGGLPSSRLNQEARQFFYLLQELIRDRRRSLVLSPSAADNIDTAIPVPQAGRVIMGNAAGDGFENGPNAGDIIAAQQYAEEAEISAVAAEAAQLAAEAAQLAAEAAAAGMKWRPPVFVATTGNITLSGQQVIDGVFVGGDRRVLVRGQTNATQNGVYISSVGAWTRASDADTWEELVSQVVAVEAGTAWADYTFICTVNSGGALGSTNVTWSTFKIVIPDGSIVAAKLAAALDLTGRNIDVATQAPGTNSTRAASAAFVQQEKVVRSLAGPTVVTNQTNISITGIPATAQVVRISLSHLSGMVGNQALLLRTSADGGSSYDAGGADYAYQFRRKEIGSAETNPESAGEDAITLLTEVGNSESVNNQHWAGWIEISRPGNPDYCTINYQFCGRDTGSVFTTVVGGGQRLAASAVDAIRLLMSSGNINTAEYRVTYW